mmetsp:Transcript_34878/g.108469  ORF Transcript_34878/g.108469 Transcript_34878/m.108469 type:complete len:262 (-) Transcript_34878:1675-2460(-)
MRPVRSTSPHLDLLALAADETLILDRPQRVEKVCVGRELLLPLAQPLVQRNLGTLEGDDVATLPLLREDLLEQRLQLLGALAARGTHANNELLHVDEAGLGVYRRCVGGGLEQADGLGDVGLNYLLAQLHLCKGFRDADEGLQDPRRGGDDALRGSLVAKVDVALGQRIGGLVCERGEDPALCKGNVAPEELGVHRRIRPLLHARLRIHGHEVLAQSPVRVAVPLVQHEPDQVEPRHQVLRQVDVLHNRELRIVGGFLGIC